MVVAIVGVVGAAAMVVSPRMLSQARADGSVQTALSALKLIQERAVGERRNFEVVFTSPNRIRFYRVAVPPATGSTLIQDIKLETGQTFMKYPAITVNTPDGFHNEDELGFGVTPTMTFTSEGSFVDSSGDVLNGTIYLGHAGQDWTSARAITIFGATGLVRSWRWDGRNWVE